MQLVAVNLLHYGGKTHQPGDKFEAPEIHARLLVQYGNARTADAVRRLETAAVKAEESPPFDAPRKPRHYKRRDMRAEE